MASESGNKTTKEDLLRAISSPSELRRFQAREMREQAARLLRDAEAFEAEAAALEAAGGK